MTAISDQIRTELELGCEYLSRLPRRIRRPDETLQPPTETELAVSHDAPGIPLTRIIPKEGSEVQGGPETISTTRVPLPQLNMRGRPEAFDYLILSVPGHGTVISSAPLGPTLNGDIWKFEQAGEFTFKAPARPLFRQ